MERFTQSVKKTKSTSDKNSDFDGKCEQGSRTKLTVYNYKYYYYYYYKCKYLNRYSRT